MKKLKTLLAGGACKGSTTVPFGERPPVDRKNIGPLTRYYLETALSLSYPFHEIRDISERSLQQAIRDTVSFYWQNASILESLWEDPFLEYTEHNTGEDFWMSRNGIEGGFLKHAQWDDPEDSPWDLLHQSAFMSFGPRTVILHEKSSHRLGTKKGRIDIVWQGWDGT
jgi:hypothetical protein